MFDWDYRSFCKNILPSTWQPRSSKDRKEKNPGGKISDSKFFVFQKKPTAAGLNELNLESSWKQPAEEGSSEENLSVFYGEEVPEGKADERVLTETKVPPEVFDLIHTISEIQLPRERSFEELSLLKKLLNNKNVTVEKKNLSDSIVTDTEEKLLIIRKLSMCAREKLSDEEKSILMESLTGSGLKKAEAASKTGGGVVFCKECNLFMKRSSYAGHNRFVHRKIKKYLCQTCGYAAHTGSILRQHIQAVHVGYTFECDKCLRKFNLLKRLRKHKEECHSKAPGAAKKSLLCHYCGLNFSRLSYLKVHFLTHTGEAPLQCQYCDRRFKFRWARIQHERLHTGVKPYKCEFCEERFTQNRVRKIHESKVHGRESEKKTEPGVEEVRS